MLKTFLKAKKTPHKDIKETKHMIYKGSAKSCLMEGKVVNAIMLNGHKVGGEACSLSIYHPPTEDGLLGCK
jgi:hypothetical protein